MNNTFLKLKNVVAIIASFCLLSGCSTPSLNYRLDPEITMSQPLRPAQSIIAISVEDFRQIETVAQDEILVEFEKGQIEEATRLKQSLIETFTHQNFRTLSDPLLADLAIHITIEKFIVKFKPEMLKSVISVESQLRVKVSTGGKSKEKRYSSNRSQEVATKPTSNEVTGVVNQVLSQQLTNALNDRELTHLMN